MSDSAIEFVKYLLDPDPQRRPTAKLCLQHYWIVQTAPSLQPRSRSLHKSFSQQPVSIISSKQKPVDVIIISVASFQPHRTRSQKSNRSIPRSDAGRRIKPEELERLMKDSEFQQLATRYAKHSRTLLPAPVGPNARVIAVVWWSSHSLNGLELPSITDGTNTSATQQNVMSLSVSSAASIQHCPALLYPWISYLEIFLSQWSGAFVSNALFVLFVYVFTPTDLNVIVVIPSSAQVRLSSSNFVAQLPSGFVT